MNFVIEKNIPIAPQVRKSKFPFSEMENGDSFTIPLDGKEAGQISSNIHNHARHQNVRIAVRRFDDHIRAWKLDTIINED